MPKSVGENILEVKVVFDPRVHPKQAILRACYSLDHLGDFRIESDDEQLVVHCKPLNDSEALVTRLRSAAIDFSVRESIETRTRHLRDLIWRTAFAEVQGANMK